MTKLEYYASDPVVYARLVDVQMYVDNFRF